MRGLLSSLALAALMLAAPALHAEEHGAAAPHAAEAPEADVGAPAAHGAHHVPTFGDINWFYGWFGEREGVEASLMFRPKGMPAPFGVWIANAALLYGFLFRVARKPLKKALKDRKSNIMRGIEEAQRMKRDAKKRLADYEAKLGRIEEEVERVRQEMRTAAEAEREKILADARARRERMEKDAQLLVAQELAAARDALKAEMVTAAMGSAATAVKARLRADDQQRLADEFLAGLSQAKSFGGSVSR